MPLAIGFNLCIYIEPFLLMSKNRNDFHLYKWKCTITAFNVHLVLNKVLIDIINHSRWLQSYWCGQLWQLISFDTISSSCVLRFVDAIVVTFLRLNDALYESFLNQKLWFQLVWISTFFLIRWNMIKIDDTFI